jgi:hypothetical protein
MPLRRLRQPLLCVLQPAAWLLPCTPALLFLRRAQGTFDLVMGVYKEILPSLS